MNDRDGRDVAICVEGDGGCGRPGLFCISAVVMASAVVHCELHRGVSGRVLRGANELVVSDHLPSVCAMHAACHCCEGRSMYDAVHSVEGMITSDHTSFR